MILCRSCRVKATGRDAEHHRLLMRQWRTANGGRQTDRWAGCAVGVTARTDCIGWIAKYCRLDELVDG